MRQPPRLCLSSGKGGVGKTSLAVNLAFAMAGLGRRVLLVDGDLGLANVDVLLGLTPTGTIRDILEGGLNPLDALVFVEPGLGVLPASSGVAEMADLDAEAQAQLGRMLERLASDFEVVLVDAAAGLGPSVLWFNAWAHLSLLVVTPDPTSMTDAYALIKVLSLTYHRHLFQIILNQTADDREGRQAFATLSQVAARFLKVRLTHLITVPSDPAVRRGIREQTPFVHTMPRSRAGQAMITLAHRLDRVADLLGPGESAAAPR
jgi:flagellar biosynthesis protein FlhG